MLCVAIVVAAKESNVNVVFDLNEVYHKVFNSLAASIASWLLVGLSAAVHIRFGGNAIRHRHRGTLAITDTPLLECLVEILVQLIEGQRESDLICVALPIGHPHCIVNLEFTQYLLQYMLHGGVWRHLV